MIRFDAIKITPEVLNLIARIDEFKGASRNTLKQHFRTLVENKHLVKHGAGRGIWYKIL